MCFVYYYFEIHYLQGLPPAPVVNPITVVDKDSMNTTYLISWSQSNCAVQYVVTILNSSDISVYLNFTISNTNTTVTLPTGVEFCVAIAAVDSIGRKGPYTIPLCYCEYYYSAHILINKRSLNYRIYCFIHAALTNVKPITSSGETPFCCSTHNKYNYI